MTTLDLHGYYLHDAWNAFNNFITDSYYTGVKQCRVITGHGSIKEELPVWAHNSRYIKYITPSYDGGAVTVHLRKK